MPCLPIPPREVFPDEDFGRRSTSRSHTVKLRVVTSLDEVSPAATAPFAAPGPDPVTIDRIVALERQVLRLRRDLDRMARVMALLEHDLAIERITTTQPTVMDRLGTWFAEWASWLSPWAPRARPRVQRPLT